MTHQLGFGDDRHIPQQVLRDEVLDAALLGYLCGCDAIRQLRAGCDAFLAGCCLLIATQNHQVIC